MPLRHYDYYWFRHLYIDYWHCHYDYFRRQLILLSRGIFILRHFRFRDIFAFAAAMPFSCWFRHAFASARHYAELAIDYITPLATIDCASDIIDDYFAYFHCFIFAIDFIRRCHCRRLRWLFRHIFCHITLLDTIIFINWAARYFSLICYIISTLIITPLLTLSAIDITIIFASWCHYYYCWHYAEYFRCH